MGRHKRNINKIMATRKKLDTNFDKWCIKENYSDQRIAKLAEVDRKTIQTWREDPLKMRARHIALICKKLGYDLGWFMEEIICNTDTNPQDYSMLSFDEQHYDPNVGFIEPIDGKKIETVIASAFPETLLSKSESENVVSLDYKDLVKDKNDPSSLKEIAKKELKKKKNPIKNLKNGKKNE